MKKLIIIAVMLITAWQTDAQNNLYSVNYIDNKQYSTTRDTFPYNRIADDYGPRKLSSDANKWHGGIDFNGAGEDLDDLILAPEAGTIVNINRIHEHSERYVLLEAGNHRYAFVHMFGVDNLPTTYNDSTIILTKMNGDINKNRYAIFINLNGTLYSIGQVDGQAKYNGILVDVSNSISQYQPLGPIGGSTGYSPHLHLCTLPLSKDKISDTENKNPLEFIHYSPSKYNIEVRSESNSNGISLKYPGTMATSLRIRPKLLNDAEDNNRYEQIYDVNKVNVLIKKSGETSFQKIKGIKGELEIDLGGKIGTKLKNHKKAIKNGANNYGSWTNYGINSFAYNTGATQSYDDFYYPDFVSRIHKSHSSNTTTKYADFPTDARYNDGKYYIKGEVTNMIDQKIDGSDTSFTIDNYLPYLNHVQINRVYHAGGPVPSSPEGLIYQATSFGYDPNLSLVGDGKVSFSKNVKSGCWQDGFDLLINVYSSEPLQSLTCHIPQISSTPIVLTSTDKVFWSQKLTSPNLSPGVYTMEFQGNDLSDNPLLDIAYYETSGVANKSIHVPTRIATSGATVWSPNPTGNQKGKDTYHQFTINNDCQSGSHFGDGGLTTREIPAQCPSCLNYEDFSIHQERMIGDSGNTTITLNYPVGLVNLTALWKNAAGEIIGTGNQNTLSAGEYCIDITYNDCCQMSKCFIVEGCNNVLNDIIFTPEINGECENAGPWNIELVLSTTEKVSEVNWYHNDSLLSESDLNLIATESGNYSFHLATLTGCTIDSSIIIQSPKLADKVQAQITHITLSGNGSIDITSPQELTDEQSGWSFEWYFEGEPLGANWIEDLTDITEEGEYSIIYTNDFTGCTIEKKYIVQDLRYTVVDFMNPTCGGYAYDGTATLQINSKYPYKVGWDAGPQCCIAPPTNSTNTLTDAAPYEYSFGIFDMNDEQIVEGGFRFDCCMQDDGEGGLEYKNPKPSINDVQIYNTSKHDTCDGMITYTHNMPTNITTITRYYQQPDNILIDDLNNLCPGTYSIFISDGCRTDSASFEVRSCEDYQIKYTSTIINTCSGYSEGKVLLTVTSGEPPFTYLWSNGSTESSITNLGTGPYTVTITDKGHCEVVSNSYITDRVQVTRDNSCNIYCNGEIVDSKLPTYLGEYDENNCRYRKEYCSDGYYIGLKYVGSYTHIDEYESSCLIQERCFNNQPLNEGYVVDKDTVAVLGETCIFVEKCAGFEVSPYMAGNMSYDYSEDGYDSDFECFFAFTEDRCEFGNLYLSYNKNNTLQIEKECPIQIGKQCKDQNGNWFVVDSSNQDNYCWAKFKNGNTLFHEECINANYNPVDCFDRSGWETLLGQELAVRGEDYIPDFPPENSLDLDKRLIFYPNPTKSYIKIQNLGKIPITKIEIFNIIGTKVYEKENSQDLVVDNIQLLIKNVSGSYSIVVTFKDGKKQIEKIIKN